LFTSILQPTHLLLILIVALLVLGPKRLPDAGRALGKGLREFRDSISGDDIDDLVAPAPSPAHGEDARASAADRAGGAQPVAGAVERADGDVALIGAGRDRALEPQTTHVADGGQSVGGAAGE
jgi:sec-independent protein translocase protein TatA